MIDQYYLGSDCYFLVKYFSDERRNSGNWVQEDQIISGVLAFQSKKNYKTPQKNMCFVKRKSRMQSYLRIYIVTVFEVYPTPMNDPIYIKKCMNEAYCIFHLQV